MLEYYGLENHYEQIKEWYDGCRFGNTDAYCPWDVTYVSQLRFEPDTLPRACWINSSGNAIIRTLLQKADDQTVAELDQIEEKDYEEEFLDDDITTILKYGIACRRRSCRVRMGQ